MAYNTTTPRAEYTATTSQTDFVFTFKIFNTSDIVVYQTPSGNVADDVADLLVLTTDYTVTIDGDNGGTVILNSGAGNGDRITLLRSLAITRETDYQNGGDLLAETIDNDQNYQTYLVADLKSSQDRFLKLPTSLQSFSSTLPTPVSSSYLRWNSAGDALENDETIPDAVITTATNATNAANSAAAAATSASNASNSASAAATSASNASNSASAAATSETNASNSASAAATSASNASTSETNASNSASAAATSASNASTSETNASNSASAAATSASAAATSETNASNSASAAATSYDNFDDRYLGEKTSDPLTDNDGDPLLTGALYFNTVANAMKVYNGAAWQLAYASINTSMISKSYYDRSESFDATQNNLTIPDIYVIVNASLISITSETININTAGYWDDATYATASNRAGKDFYVYALEAGGYILSNNSSYPTGYNATNSRKIAGFHCLCSNVGTISGHSLTGYLTGDILPRSIWDLKDKPRSAPEGMSKNYDGVWVDIYLPSWDGTKLVSVYGGTVADGADGWHNYKFEQRFGMIGKKLIRQTEFVVASLGSNQGTNITGSANPGTTGAHTDTAGRRMISDIGCEDMCGAYWQWSRDPGGSVASEAAWANAYDGNDSGVAGQHYQAPYRALLGGAWASAAGCGSRASFWGYSPLALDANRSGRGVAEPVDSQN